MNDSIKSGQFAELDPMRMRELMPDCDKLSQYENITTRQYVYIIGAGSGTEAAFVQKNNGCVINVPPDCLRPFKRFID